MPLRNLFIAIAITFLLASCDDGDMQESENEGSDPDGDVSDGDDHTDPESESFTSSFR